ncbi:class I SAM-dependent methyltransferase [Luteibacter sp.]|uniref:class I SAM-dependent methyltransferase n=1 Tax=Luteibacter sp. TaxID=1886636 RepID=UPI003F81524E
MGMPDARDWLASERAVLDQIALARTQPGHPWLLRETCPSARQQYFILQCGGLRWVGRRCRGRASGTPSHAIRSDDLLGDPFRFGFGGNETHLDVTLRDGRQAAAFLAMAAADASAELIFPFPALDAHGREWVCPPQYWQVASRHAARFAEDEHHLRELCARTLTNALPPGALVHDPACSTGDFVAAMARACPGLRFTGSDLCPAMVDTARRHHGHVVPDFACADATALPASSVDGLLLRFLNVEVVTRKQALTLFRRLATTIRPGGVAVLFGHSGVLVPVHAEAARLGWQVLTCTAPTADGRGLFQWYVLRAGARRTQPDLA